MTGRLRDLAKSAFQEAEHPRDPLGRFADKLNVDAAVANSSIGRGSSKYKVRSAGLASAVREAGLRLPVHLESTNQYRSRGKWQGVTRKHSEPGEPPKHLIRISTSEKPDQANRVFFHELGHAMQYEVDLERVARSYPTHLGSDRRESTLDEIVSATTASAASSRRGEEATVPSPPRPPDAFGMRLAGYSDVQVARAVERYQLLAAEWRKAYGSMPSEVDAEATAEFADVLPPVIVHPSWSPSFSKAVGTSPYLAKAADLKGSMVALHPSPAAARSLAAKGGEPADRLHVTLVYVPGEAGADPKLLDAITAGWARTVPPVDAEVTGHTTFTGGDEPAHVALLSAPGLEAHQARLADALDRAGVERSREYGFIPHVTVGYGEEAPDMPRVGTRLRFRAASAVSGGDRRDHRFAGVAKAGTVGGWIPSQHPRDPLDGRWIVVVDNRTNTSDAQGLSLDEAASRVAAARGRGSANVRASAKVSRRGVQTRPLTAAEQEVLVAAAAWKVKAG